MVFFYEVDSQTISRRMLIERLTGNKIGYNKNRL